MHLLDANTLIAANKDYYPFDRVPEYWEWIPYQGEIGNIKIPVEIWDEFTPKLKALQDWKRGNRDALVLDHEGYDADVPTILAQYGDNLTERELDRIGKDPFLIAAAFRTGATVVSREGTKRSLKRANRRVPDICADLGINCINDHQLIAALDWSTSWRRP